MREIAVVLHNVRSIHNVGSIFRTADAAGVRKIYLGGITPGPKDRLGKWRKDFTKVSLGAEKWKDWEKIRNTAEAINELKSGGYKIFAVEQSRKSIPFDKIKKRSAMTCHSALKIALVLGNEVRGLPPSILEAADKILEIPMHGRKESLNVAVAFGIAVFRLIHP
ncbi:MAG: tRNA/rRNA methyltransferase [Candidatus Jorgensenbacteria bacterium GW2011_GWA1_48_11]|uniref:tRNA/rRNA methyltransferase n=1 Tax=Candidatus Jorgensenbacteria bacterium GW2011_GWA1_48_11 TaxID=1618660 RepID=A0A0G1WM57_9BACT|nr:MAG: tRNA/rRNA methyltransferase [Candidatus Jorgensenbacteria bacterium GW2011_GWA1_48_11]KKW11918.1 MAG: tRNA/rRNA methyltransferase [Candidatus Jorgensenbacteria bacterium GW2011_GWB1_49_9]